MKSGDIRRSFLDFFKRKDHAIVPSVSLIPSAPNLLFTNAGMNAFVPYFLGEQKSPHKRIANTQKCIRAGGKHNDLEEVGFDTYHHTFFEMLGNWSFGNYFKKEAINWAWELLTKEWKLPKDRLYATVYKPSENDPAEFDQDAYDCWKEIFSSEGMDPSIHICPGNKEENFWMMGNTGPCGPSSEIHIDLTIKGDTQGKLVNKNNPNCIELWNLVFIQFNAETNGKYTPLLSRHIDTGMGFERIAGIFASTKNFQDFSQSASNYDSDLFTDIFTLLTKLTGYEYHATIPKDRNKMSDTEKRDCAFRVISDHIRTLIFSIADGIVPGNEGRNYVVRRIFRRAVLFAKRIQLPHGSLVKLTDPLIDKLKDVFPELLAQRDLIIKYIRTEEDIFERTLDRGLQHFEKLTSNRKKSITGKEAFKLFDTYGFPIDLTQIIANERSIGIDLSGFKKEMNKQREQARAAQKKTLISIKENPYSQVEKTVFVGYETGHLSAYSAKIKDVIQKGNDNFVIFDKTPFYAEMGGQLGDSGFALIDDVHVPILDTVKNESGYYLHKTNLQGIDTFIGKSALLSVDTVRRNSIQRNHTATHLLHWALRDILGQHVHQSGSLVAHDYLRFDFNHIEQTNKNELQAIESCINERILENDDVSSYEIPYSKKPTDVLAFFGDKYGPIVRIVDIGGYSKELCAGTHVKQTGQIGLFKIISESAIASGTRRIEAIVGMTAYDLMAQNHNLLHNLTQKLSCKFGQLNQRFESLIEHRNNLEKQINSYKQRNIVDLAYNLAKKANKISHLNWVIAKIDLNNTEEMRSLAVGVSEHIDASVVILGSIIKKKATILVLCSKKAVELGHNAGTIVSSLSKKLDGKGGGKPDFAMGGGNNIKELEAVLNEFQIPKD